MSTSMGEKQVCETKSSNGGNMDSLPYNLNRSQNEQLLTHPRPVSVSLSKLAELINRLEYKPKHQQSSISKDCGKAFPNPDHQEREHTLQKLHSCQRCGQKFALLSSLQLHNCPSPPPMCQECRGKPQWGSSCTTCGDKPPSQCLSKEPFDHDNSPYVCTPCGRAFSHKQEFLYHQQAGGCQPVPVSPSSPATTPSPSYSSSPPSPPCTGVSSSTCTLCSRTFRSAAGLASHQRSVHKQKKRSSGVTFSGVTTSGTTFPCRSCDKVFSQTSLLYLHRKEEHRREIMVGKTQRNSGKTTRQRRKGETYPCLHCGKVFLHHLTRWAHFKHFSAHHQTHLTLSSKSTKAGKVCFNPNETNESRPLEGCKRLKRGRPRTKPQPASKDSEQKVETDDGETDEDEEYTCVLCENIQAALKAPKKVPETVDACKCCSVCTGGITLAEIPENCENKVYHCVPCAEVFIALETFLEHCQKHLIRECEEDEDLLSD